MNVSRALFLVTTLSILGGCGLFSKDEPPPPPPARVELKIEAAPNINPDLQGRSSPLLLRIYELKDVSAFNAADFFNLYEKEQSALGVDLVRKDEFIVKPGERRETAFEASQDTRFIGVFAAYRKLDNAQWRAAAPIPPHQTTSFGVKLSDTQIELDVASRKPPAIKK
jgi:type VI secretion system protein VasD